MVLLETGLQVILPRLAKQGSTSALWWWWYNSIGISVGNSVFDSCMYVPNCAKKKKKGGGGKRDKMGAQFCLAV